MNGKIIAKITKPNTDAETARIEMAKSLLGIIPADITAEEALAERTGKI